MEYEIRIIIALLEVPRMGRRSVWQLATRTHPLPSHLSELLDAISDARKEGARLAMPTRADLSAAVDRADIILDRASQLGIRAVGIGDPEYPTRLMTIADPPVALYIKGNIGAVHRPIASAVVGTREPSSWGARAGERLAQRLAERNITVISGLALGCDTVAHRGCLNANGTTVAVLAHGLHTVYPASNRPLAEEILMRGGCLVSEYAPDVKANRNFFVERDRLQSGLSDGVLVIETDIEGGTMHTVKACLSQQRVLACLAHPPQHANAKSRGNEMLIGRGDALPLSGPEDVDAFIRRMEMLPKTRIAPTVGPETDADLFGSTGGSDKWA